MTSGSVESDAVIRGALRCGVYKSKLSTLSCIKVYLIYPSQKFAIVYEVRAERTTILGQYVQYIIHMSSERS